MNKTPDCLFNKNFSLIVAGQCVTMLSSTVYYVVLVLYLKQMTGSATIIGVVELLAFLPWVVLGPLAGALVDRTNKKTVIVWSYFLRGMLMIFLFVASLEYFLGLKTIDIGIAQLHFSSSFPFTVYAVFCVTLCMGTIDSAYNAAFYSIIPALLAKDKIQKGNSLLQGSAGVLGMIGNALGGILFGLLGGALVFLLNGVSCLVAAFASSFISVENKRNENSTVTSSVFLKDVREGFRFIWENKGLRNQTIVYSLSNLLFPTVMLSLPFLIEDVLKLGNAYYGYLLSVLTLSSIVGYFVFGWFKTTDTQNYGVICAIFVVESLLFLILSLTTHVVIVFALLSLLSVCMAISRLINTSLKQKVIPEELRGRVFATLDSINGGLAPLSFAVSGVIIDLVNKNILLIFLIIFLVYVLLTGVFVTSKSIRYFYLSSAPGTDKPSI